MSVQLIQSLIAEGKYDAALVESQKTSPSFDLVFQSRVAELTGHFDDALILARRGQKQANTPVEQVASAIAQTYALWRLFLFQEGHDVLDEVQGLLYKDEIKVSSWHGTFHNIRGLLHWKYNDLDDAMDSFQEALLLRKEYSTQSSVAYTLNNIGNTFLKMEDDIGAEKFYYDSRKIREQLGYKPALAASANSFGRLEDSRDEFDKARQHHLKCLKLWQEVGNTQFIAKAYRFLALNAALRDEIDEMSNYFKQSDRLFREIENETDLQTNTRLRKKQMI